MYRQQRIDIMQPMRSNISIYVYTHFTYIHKHMYTYNTPLLQSGIISTKLSLSLSLSRKPEKPISVNLSKRNEM